MSNAKTTQKFTPIKLNTSKKKKKCLIMAIDVNWGGLGGLSSLKISMAINKILNLTY